VDAVSWDGIVDTLSRPQVWQLRHHGLIPGRGRDLSLLRSAFVSSCSHPASCSVGMGGGGLAWSRQFMSINCSAEVECVCGAEPPLPWMPAWHTQEQLYRYQIALKTLNYISVCIDAYTHLLLSSVSICYSWTQMTVFFLPWIGGLVAASICRFVWTPVAFSATQFEAVWCRDIAFDPLISAARG